MNNFTTKQYETLARELTEAMLQADRGMVTKEAELWFEHNVMFVIFALKDAAKWKRYIGGPGCSLPVPVPVTSYPP